MLRTESVGFFDFEPFSFIRTVRSVFDALHRVRSVTNIQYSQCIESDVVNALITCQWWFLCFMGSRTPRKRSGEQRRRNLPPRQRRASESGAKQQERSQRPCLYRRPPGEAVHSADLRARRRYKTVEAYIKSALAAPEKPPKKNKKSRSARLVQISVRAAKVSGERWIPRPGSCARDA